MLQEKNWGSPGPPQSDASPRPPGASTASKPGRIDLTAKRTNDVLRKPDNLTSYRQRVSYKGKVGLNGRLSYQIAAHSGGIQIGGIGHAARRLLPGAQNAPSGLRRVKAGRPISVAVRGFFALGALGKVAPCRAGGNRPGGSSTRDKAGALMQPVAALGCDACVGRRKLPLGRRAGLASSVPGADSTLRDKSPRGGLQRAG
jgi:hypothetical protein